MERAGVRASARQVCCRVAPPSGMKNELWSISRAGYYNPNREAGEVCYQCVVDA